MVGLLVPSTKNMLRPNTSYKIIPERTWLGTISFIEQQDTKVSKQYKSCARRMEFSLDRWLCRARSEPGGTRWRTGREVKGKLVNGVGSQYSHATSKNGISSITKADAHTSAASSRLNWRPHRFEWTRPFRGKTKSGFCACAIMFRMSYTADYIHTAEPIFHTLCFTQTTQFLSLTTSFKMWDTRYQNVKSEHSECLINVTDVPPKNTQFLSYQIWLLYLSSSWF